MVIAFRIRLIANRPPNVNPNRRAIRFSSNVILRVNVSTDGEWMRCRNEAKLYLRRYLHGDPDNVIAFAMVYCCGSHDIR